jgi:predicted transcriptional regulator
VGHVTRGPDPEIQTLDILTVFALSTDPAFVPAEIADQLDVTTEGARHRMETLVQQGYLERKKPGQRTVLYWVTDDGRDYVAEHINLH